MLPKQIWLLLEGSTWEQIEVNVVYKAKTKINGQLYIHIKLKMTLKVSNFFSNLFNEVNSWSSLVRVVSTNKPRD